MFFVFYAKQKINLTWPNMIVDKDFSQPQVVMLTAESMGLN